jgi:hypothetical protein
VPAPDAPAESEESRVAKKAKKWNKAGSGYR